MSFQRAEGKLGSCQHGHAQTRLRTQPAFCSPVRGDQPGVGPSDIKFTPRVRGLTLQATWHFPPQIPPESSVPRFLCLASGYRLVPLPASFLIDCPHLQPSGDHGHSLLCDAEQLSPGSAPSGPATSWPWLTDEHITKIGHLQRDRIIRVLAGADGSLQGGRGRGI